MAEANRMEEWEEIACPECGTSGRVPEWWASFRKVSCKNCGERFEYQEGKNDE